MHVSNHKCIRRLSFRALKAAKKRNIIAIIAIALTTLLFTSLFTVMMSVNASYETYTFRQIGGYSHGTFKDVTDEQIKALQAHPDIKKSGTRIVIGTKSDDGFEKCSAEISYMDPNTAKWSYATPTTGRVPQKGHEIAMDTGSLKLLGVTPKLGEKVSLSYTLCDSTQSGSTQTATFTLVGYWNFDDVMPVHYINVSRDYVDEAIAIGQKEGLTNFRSDLNVMLRSSFNIEKTMENIDTDLGYNWNTRDEENSVRIGANWGYTASRLSDNPDTISLVGVICFLLLIVFTGFLIIYNIFQISVTSDIRFYGLLKTIGVTPAQLRRIIRQQALFLCLIGIPIGLVLGYLIGCQMTPLILKSSNLSLSGTISTSPWIFLGAGLFALGTVLLSCFRPGRMASRVSPVEAAKYTELSRSHAKKRRTRGARVHQMAFANLGRNKRKTVLVVISLSLSIVLLNILVLFVNGFDMDKYLSRMLCGDFIVSNNSYFRYDGNMNENISQNTIDEIRQNTQNSLSGCGYKPKDGIQPVTWITEKTYRKLHDDIYTKEELEQNLSYEDHRNGRIASHMQLEILDSSLLSKLTIHSGDLSALSDTSKHAIAIVVDTDDYGNMINPEKYPKVGDTLKVSYIRKDGVIDARTGEPADDSTPEQYLQYHIFKSRNINYTVCALVSVPYSMSYRYFSVDSYSTVLTHDQFLADSGQKASRLFYLFDTPNRKAETSAERYLKRQTSVPASELSFDSRASQRASLNSFKHLFIICGGFLCAVIALIGTLNFINAILTGILTRQHEFAVLQSVGMTNRQLRTMLIEEGLFYAISASLLALALSTVLTFPIGHMFTNTVWFFTARPTLVPVFIAVLVFLIVGCTVPALLYRQESRVSVVDRLRRTE